MLSYKCTRADGTDFRTGTVNYRALLLSGEPLVHPNPEPPRKVTTGDTCGKGYHVSPTLLLATTFGDTDHRPFAWFEIAHESEDVIEGDARKSRLRGFTRVVRECTRGEVFGADFDERLARVQADIQTWKTIPWLKPAAPVSDETVGKLFGEWRAALTPWLKPGEVLPDKFRIVRTAAAEAAEAAEEAAAAAEAAAAKASAAAAVTAMVAVETEAAEEAAAAEAETESAAEEAAAAAEAAAAEAAEEATAAAEAEAMVVWRHWVWYYFRPYWALRTHARWQIAGLHYPCPATPLVTLYRLGCWPIGYVRGEFVVYVPDVV